MSMIKISDEDFKVFDVSYTWHIVKKEACMLGVQYVEWCATYIARFTWTYYAVFLCYLKWLLLYLLLNRINVNSHVPITFIFT